MPRATHTPATAKRSEVQSLPVGTVKRSVTIDARLDEEAHRLVGERGFSAFVNDALNAALQRDHVEAWLATRVRDLGAIPQSDLRAAARTLAKTRLT